MESPSLKQVDSVEIESKRDTDAMMESVTHWAKTLMKVVDQCQVSKDIGGKKYLEVEGWQLIAQFARTDAVIDWVRPFYDVTNGDIAGYEARAKLLNRQGAEIGSGESLCGFDAFPCKGRQGTDRHKAARSAAQTWAISRAIRNKFSFVAKIAGFEPVPVDEIDGDTKRENVKAARQESIRSTPPLDTRNYVAHLGQALIDFCRGVDGYTKEDLLTEFTGKATLKGLSQMDAKKALQAFEAKYLGVEDIND